MSEYSISLENETDNKIPTDDIVAMLKHHYGKLYLDPQVELSVTFVSEEQISTLYQEWLGLPGPTDVLSFPMDELEAGTPEEHTPEGMLGDIVVCPSIAAAQTEGHSVDDEILLLVTHGLLHLLGHDHYEPDEKKVMFDLQDRLLSEFLGRDAPVSATAGGQ